MCKKLKKLNGNIFSGGESNNINFLIAFPNSTQEFSVVDGWVGVLKTMSPIHLGPMLGFSWTKTWTKLNNIEY